MRAFRLVLAMSLTSLVAVPAAAVDVEPEDILERVPTTARSFIGASVAIHGDVALVGSPGVDGGGSGQVFVFRRMAGTREWAMDPEQTITNPDLSLPTGDNFGASIAWVGDLVVIGAPGDGPTTSSDAGSAYLFRYTEGGTAPHFARVTAGLPRPAGGPTRFGTSVAVSADWIVVGAPGTGSSTPGAAYVYAAPFESDPIALPMALPDADDLFGMTVAVAANTILVGAPEFDNPNNEGLVLSYQNVGPTDWGTPTMLSNGMMGSAARFGTSMAIAEDGLRLAIGAPFTSNMASNRGAVYVFDRAAATDAWPSNGVVITASDGSSADFFGSSVAVSAERDVLVGAPNDDAPGAAPADEHGSAYLFRGADPIAEMGHFIRGAPRMMRDRLGTSVAIDGDTVLVGATTEGTGVTREFGFVASFLIPLDNGEACTSPQDCGSGICDAATSVCCESVCDGMCQACDASGECAAADEGGACMIADCPGTCNLGACMTDDMCDTGPIVPDDPRDVGPDVGRRVTRVSGCRCEVGRTSATPGLVALGLLGLALVLRRARRVAPIAALALVAVMNAGAAEAQDGTPPAEGEAAAAEPDDETQALLLEALREYDTGNYEEAYALFLRVHDARPTARTARALGNAAFELRRYRQAVDWLTIALAEERNPLTDVMRVEVEGVLRRARAFLGTFTIHTNVEGAAVSVDGHLLEGTDTAVLDLGEHEIEVTADGWVPASRAVTVHGGEAETIEITLARAPTIGGPRYDPGAIYRDVGWAGVVAGGVFMLGGIVSTAIWADTVGTLNANLENGVCFADENENVITGPGGGANAAICLDQQNRYRLTLPFAYVGFIGGAILLGTGLGLVLGAPSAPDEDDDAAVSVRCGPFGEGGLMCAGTF